MREIDQFFLQQDEPLKSCLHYLRTFIVNYEKNITEAWKFRMPFFCYNGKMFCYLWINKKTNQPYIGFVEGKKLEHPLLIKEKRMRMKILPLNAEHDIPVNCIKEILKMALDIYRTKPLYS